MMKTQLLQYISNNAIKNNGEEKIIHLCKDEKEYAEQHSIISDDIKVILEEASFRFKDAYIERCDKETDDTITEVELSFLNQPITYLKNHQKEFIYLESDWFDVIKVDSISLEVDDVFGIYDCLLGLKLPKKAESSIKSFLNGTLLEGAIFSLMFNQQDGLWDFNISLNHITGFREDMSIMDAYTLIYEFLFSLIVAIEEEK
ncbi:branched-chain amino acid aminotransferase [Heyndrickxia ginsengihumi]|uniref:branched-chain amino acid aminotransferase n=1 Tax=Heyndrickxia ginsengihumi TaxID=363870 RepID=UPI003D227AC2